MLLNLIFLAREFFCNISVREKEGQGLIEYGLIVVLIAIVVLIVLQALGVQILGDYQNISEVFGDGS